MSLQATEKAEATCPIIGCDADLYLSASYSVPIYRIDPPWPGAGPGDYSERGAVTSGWEVVCTEGHTVWNHVDQIRVTNALLPDDEHDDWMPEDCDNAPEFRFDAMRYPPAPEGGAS